jgi:hypothetical protein
MANICFLVACSAPSIVETWHGSKGQEQVAMITANSFDMTSQNKQHVSKCKNDVHLETDQSLQNWTIHIGSSCTLNYVMNVTRYCFSNINQFALIHTALVIVGLDDILIQPTLGIRLCNLAIVQQLCKFKHFCFNFSIR